MQGRAESGLTPVLTRVTSVYLFYTLNEGGIIIKKSSRNTNPTPLTDRSKGDAERKPFLNHKILNGFYIKRII